MLESAAVVCVPARDEERRLPRLLAALGNQTGLGCGRHDSALHVVILLNNCRDRSHVAATEAARRWPSLSVDIVDMAFPPEQAHVGSARRAALDAGVLYLEKIGRPDGVLLTTDADAVPAPDWVANNLTALAAGGGSGRRIHLGACGGDGTAPRRREGNRRTLRGVLAAHRSSRGRNRSCAFTIRHHDTAITPAPASALPRRPISPPADFPYSRVARTSPSLPRSNAPGGAFATVRAFWCRFRPG